MARMTQAEECFRSCYQAGTTDAGLRLERAVFGTDYGADGWTTVEQADKLGRQLEIGPDDRLLDIGSGRGWPGLYLSLTSGCTAVLTDQPVEGLRDARARAGRECISDRVFTVAASGQTLPFQSASFDVIVHSDVLCCLQPKLSVLRESHRLLRPNGRSGFFVIHLAPRLTAEQRHRATAAGPPMTDTGEHGYVSLLRTAGFTEVTQIDVTETFSATHRSWLRHAAEWADELAAAEPPGAFAERYAKRTATTEAVDDGLLRRSVFIARRH